MNENFWINFAIGFAIGAVAGVPIGILVARPALWLIDRVKWWRFETGRTNSYSGGDWAFTREIERTIARLGEAP